MTTKNVFAELGLSLETSTIEAWRTDLARIVRECFERSQTSQDAFARKLGIKQSVVSRIINGKIHDYSVEYLLRLCVRLETRGVGTWGPNPDEARVTNDPSMITGTATFEPVVTFAIPNPVISDPVEVAPVKKPTATSSLSFAKLN